MTLQWLICAGCRAVITFTGAGIESIRDGRFAYRHVCGALNEIAPIGRADDGRERYEIVGEVRLAQR